MRWNQTTVLTGTTLRGGAELLSGDEAGNIASPERKRPQTQGERTSLATRLFVERSVSGMGSRVRALETTSTQLTARMREFEEAGVSRAAVAAMLASVPGAAVNAAEIARRTGADWQAMQTRVESSLSAEQTLGLINRGLERGFVNRDDVEEELGADPAPGDAEGRARAASRLLPLMIQTREFRRSVVREAARLVSRATGVGFEVRRLLARAAPRAAA